MATVRPRTRPLTGTTSPTQPEQAGSTLGHAAAAGTGPTRNTRTPAGQDRPDDHGHHQITSRCNTPPVTSNFSGGRYVRSRSRRRRPHTGQLLRIRDAVVVVVLGTVRAGVVAAMTNSTQSPILSASTSWAAGAGGGAAHELLRKVRMPSRPVPARVSAPGRATRGELRPVRDAITIAILATGGAGGGSTHLLLDHIDDAIRVCITRSRLHADTHRCRHRRVRGEQQRSSPNRTRSVFTPT